MELTPQIMERFQSALFATAPMLDDWMAPGLEDSEIDDLEEKLEGRLPLEAREWWKWRNGLRDPRPGESYHGVPLILGGTEFTLSSLQECISSHEQTEFFGAPEIHADWDPSQRLFPIDTSNLASVKLRQPPSELAQLVYTDMLFFAAPYAEPICETFGDFVFMWIESLESGGLEWDPVAGWDINRERMHPELMRFAFA